jgi:hypothetical protein
LPESCVCKAALSTSRFSKLQYCFHLLQARSLNNNLECNEDIVGLKPNSVRLRPREKLDSHKEDISARVPRIRSTIPTFNQTRFLILFDQNTNTQQIHCPQTFHHHSYTHQSPTLFNFTLINHETRHTSPRSSRRIASRGRPSFLSYQMLTRERRYVSCISFHILI